MGHVAVGRRHRNVEPGLDDALEDGADRSPRRPGDECLRLGALDALDRSRDADVRRLEMLVFDGSPPLAPGLSQHLITAPVTVVSVPPEPGERCNTRPAPSACDRVTR